jgi:hypothetical protein
MRYFHCTGNPVLEGSRSRVKILPENSCERGVLYFDRKH